MKTSRKPVNYTGRKHLDGKGTKPEFPGSDCHPRSALPISGAWRCQSRDVVTHTFAVCCCNLPLRTENVISDFGESFPLGSHTALSPLTEALMRRPFLMTQAHFDTTN